MPLLTELAKLVWRMNYKDVAPLALKTVRDAAVSASFSVVLWGDG